MKKREQGILSVEASIVLTLMLLFILFLFSFGRVYRAQNLVSHATLQSVDSVALESFLRETTLQSDAADVVHLTSHITDSTAISEESLESLRSVNLPKVVREKFIAAIASSEAKADEKLRKLGVKNGLSGIDFSECKIDLANDDVIAAITYTVQMQFPVFGFDEITVTKAAKAKTFGEILFEVTTEPNNPGWGTTSGGSKVTHGSTVEITATPNYGYKFVGWSDGVTDNPRKVTVTDTQHYIAVFEKDKFGINLAVGITYNTSYAGITHSDFGTVSGAGNYDYLEEVTIGATPATHYQFAGWDDNGDGAIDNTNQTRTVTVDKTYSLKAIFKPVSYNITVKTNNSAYGSVLVSQGANRGQSIQAEYGSRVLLSATPKDSVKYLLKKWSNNSTQASATVTVKGNDTYEATFVENTYAVTFYNGNTVVHRTNVIRGSSINGSKSVIASSMASNPTKSGAIFDKWTCNGSTFTASTAVNDNVSVYAAWKVTVTLNANGGSISNAASKNYNISQGGNFNFSSYTPTRNGFTFNGWYNGSTKYTGNKSINSNITLTASWSCKHKYDNGATMYAPVSMVGAGSGCANSSITYRCNGCGHSYTNTGTGSCNYSGWCGTAHNCNWKNSYCTRGNHNWSQYGCITCIHCGRLSNGGYYYGAYRSRSCWCIKHNGHSNKTVRITGPHG